MESRAEEVWAIRFQISIVHAKGPPSPEKVLQARKRGREGAFVVHLGCSHGLNVRRAVEGVLQRATGGTGVA